MAVMLQGSDVAQLDGAAGWQLGSSGTWERLDLDDAYGSLPADASGVMLVFENTVAANRDYGAREYNNTNFTTVQDIRAEGRSPCYVKCDSNHEIEIYRSTTEVSVYLIGYFTTDATWRSSPVTVGPSSSGSWVDIDLSSYTSGGELFAILEHTKFVGDHANLRYNGSTGDNRIGGNSIGHFWLIIPLDGSDIIEANCEEINSLDLIGFITSGTKRTTGGSDLFASLSTGSYQDITLPDTGKEIALLEVNHPSAKYAFNIRPNGDTNWPEALYSDFNQHCGIDVVSIDGSDLAEAKIENTGIECYCWGYLEAAAAGIALPPIAMNHYRRRRVL